MRKRRDTVLNSRRARRRALAGIALAGLTICAALVSHFALFQGNATARISYTSTPTPDVSPYLYFVIKQTGGFVLARAHAGTNNQPTEAPQVVASFDDAFGQSTADNVISLQTSPDGHYLAIDGTHSDGELLWIFNTLSLKLSREPANVSGTFLHWLPGTDGSFLYRPILPLGPDQSGPDAANWHPGLWIGNAITDAFINIDIHLPSTFLVDALPSPDGSQIIYSTCSGMGMGSDIWTVDRQGQHLAHLLQLANGAQDIAGMFTWSPNGQDIAYERLDDSPTPFLPAGLWVMNRQGSNQRLLAQTDGGHGFRLRWSPDGTKIAFVARTNPTATMADQTTQALKSAVDVVDVKSGHIWSVANPTETGAQINVSPAWSANSAQITFAAFNPLNPELGGSIRYWSVPANPKGTHPDAVQISPAITHVIALG